MRKIEWDVSFSVDNIEIDNQHKRWFEILNNINNGMVDRETSYSEITVETLEAMHEYTKMHFQFEEEYMRKIGYPDIVKHFRIHKEFDNLVYSYNRDLIEGRIVLNTELIKLIKNWLIDHILEEDKKYAEFLKA